MKKSEKDLRAKYKAAKKPRVHIGPWRASYSGQGQFYAPADIADAVQRVYDRCPEGAKVEDFRRIKEAGAVFIRD